MNKKQVREAFRKTVFERDKYRCRKCGSAGPIDAHHITDRNEMSDGGYVKENGISLCAECHEKAEVWHRSNKTKVEEGFHPNDLYKLIGSSYEKAINVPLAQLNRATAF